MKCIPQILTLLAMLFCPNFNIIGQNSFGNEWINFDQEYFKFPVAEDGIYRIAYETLTEEGIPAGSIDVQSYQLYRMGEQVPVYISNVPGPLQPGDFIEFYGTKNRGELDSLLYENPGTQQLNPEYSLFNDTIHYFLTWGAEPGLRLEGIANDLNNLPEKEPWYTHRETIVYNDQAFKPTLDQGVAFSHFVSGEGYASSAGTGKTVNFQASSVYAGGPNGTVSVRMTTGQNTEYTYSVTLDNTEYHNATVYGIRLETFDFVIPNEDLNNNMQMRILRQSDGGNIRLATIDLEYPRMFDFDGAQSAVMHIEGGGKKYLELNAFDVSGGNPVVYDFTTASRIVADVESDIVKVGLPPSDTGRTIFVFDPDMIKTIGSVEAVNFDDLSGDNTEYIIISNPKLSVPVMGKDYVEEYAGYRSSPEGGEYRVGVHDVNMLYDQFGYGINRHSLSLKNFIRWAHATWPDLKMVFIIGKGIEYYDSRMPDGIWEQGYFVPTYGFPGSDNLLASDYGSAMPQVPVGRLAAISGDEVRVYFEKVKEFESHQRNLPQTIEDKAWMKNVIHLSGGRDAAEQQNFANRMANMGSIIEESVFGANIFAFSKANSDPVSVPVSQQILNIISEGTTIINFFGHSSSSTLDFQINNPGEWDNAGKYPIFSAMGCSAGKIHSPFRSLSEDFVNAEQGGCIAFISGSGNQYPSPLTAWGNAWYTSFGKEMYGATLGETLLDSYESLNIQSSHYQLLLQQQTLNGDPAIRCNPHPGPDFVIDAGSVSIRPQILHTELDSISVQMDIVNLGMNVSDSMDIVFRHRAPSGEETTLASIKTIAEGFQKHLDITMPIELDDAAGINTLFIELDVENAIDELPAPQAELNNSLEKQVGKEGLDFVVFANDLRPVWPENYGIVEKQGIEFLATSSNPLADEVLYHFEIDTTALFNSPLKQNISKTQPGGLIRFKPDINFNEETVYYWRVSPDSVGNQGYAWRMHSFIYLPDQGQGWNQSHYFQFIDDKFNKITLSESDRQLHFNDIYSDFSLENRKFVPGVNNARLYINGTAMIYWAWNAPVTQGLQVTVIDDKSLEFWKNEPGGLFGSHLPELEHLSGHANFPFWTNTEENRSILIDFLENTIPDGAFVLVWTINRYDNEEGYMPAEWALDSLTNPFGKNLFQVLEEQGANLIRNTVETGPVPYFFLYQKNRPEYSAREQLASSIDDEVLLDFVLSGREQNGDMRSVVIGPASNWGRLEWLEEDAEPSDVANIDIIGIGQGSDTTVLVENASHNEELSQINAGEYPYFMLRLDISDTLNRTAPQLPYWRVFYEGLPDAVYNTTLIYNFVSDSLQRGQNLELEVGVANYTQYAMDSLLVKFTLIDQANNENTFLDKFQPLDAGDEFPIEFRLATDSLTGGNYRLVVELNPGHEQPERNYTNNIAIIYFTILDDDTNPLLDVTFDGRHIMQRDLVSSKPEIRVNVKDYHSYLPMTDSSAFMLTITDPEGIRESIPMDDPRVTFHPANPENLPEENTATLFFRPEFEKDGIYGLEVQVTDASGVPSGDLAYQTEFEVITASMISEVYNYPNPFSTSTRFVYTLTGDTPPDHFKIQILTASGRIVREITELEIGSLQIGTHLTDYAWDGRDEFGDKLAAGVYLYRVVAKNADGQSFDEFTMSEASTFHKGFGKMVILR